METTIADLSPQQRARAHASPEVGECTELAATVLLATEGRFLVRHSQGEFWALRAVSCLVQPEEGDEVLTAVLRDGRAFLLAVLSRIGRVSTTLAVEGDLRIASTNGTCAIDAAQCISLRSDGNIGMHSTTLTVKAEKGRFLLGQISALASSLVARLHDAQISGHTMATVADQFMQTAKRCIRKVTEIDQLRAMRADWRTEEELCLRAENLLTGVRKLVKLDGEQIHIG